jgi:uncharacterized protein YxjI
MASSEIRSFQIEEHPTSLHQKFRILDEDDNCLYTVKSKFFAVGDKLTLIDTHGAELFKIRQKLKHIHLTFHINNATDNDDDDDEENAIATVKKVSNILKHTLEIHSIFGDYLMKRNEGTTSNEYSLTKNDKTIAEVRRKSPSPERYTVNIDEHVQQRNIPFLLTLVITLWCAQHHRVT